MMCLTPFTPATASSTRLVTWFCNSEGAAPACVTVIDTIGMSMFGKRVIGSCRKLNTPRIISTMKEHDRRDRLPDRPGGDVEPHQRTPSACDRLRRRPGARRRRRAGSCRPRDHRLAGRTPSSIWTKPSEARPGRTRRVCNLIVFHDLDRRSVGAVDDGRERDGDAGAPGEFDRAAREGADAQGGVLRQRDAHLAKAGRPVDLREDVADRPSTGRPYSTVTWAGAPSPDAADLGLGTSPSSSISPPR